MTYNWQKIANGARPDFEEMVLLCRDRDDKYLTYAVAIYSYVGISEQQWEDRENGVNYAIDYFDYWCLIQDPAEVYETVTP